MERTTRKIIYLDLPEGVEEVEAGTIKGYRSAKSRLSKLSNRRGNMGKLFGTDGIRGEANVQLTPELAFKIGRICSPLA